MNYLNNYPILGVSEKDRIAWHLNGSVLDLFKRCQKFLSMQSKSWIVWAQNMDQILLGSSMSRIVGIKSLWLMEKCHHPFWNLSFSHIGHQLLFCHFQSSFIWFICLDECLAEQSFEVGMGNWVLWDGTHWKALPPPKVPEIGTTHSVLSSARVSLRLSA